MYVIYVSSESTRHDSSNAYGYWCGKTYVYGGLIIPTCGEKPKVYKSKKRAENMGKKLLERCAYVMSFYVEEY